MPDLRDIPCLGCGCTCNDLVARVDKNRLLELENGCSLGRTWLTSELPENSPPCFLDGEPATIEAGIAQAAKILKSARYPLIYGLQEGATQSQRLAIAIAERLGGAIDLPLSQTRGPSGTTFRAVGEVTATLGEVLHRGDLILFWRCDPVTTHPRHLELYSLEARGEFLPNGRADRTCVVIDDQPTATSARSDLFLPLPAERDFEALWILRGMLAGIPLEESQLVHFTTEDLAAWKNLAERMQSAKYVSIFYDASLTKAPSGHIQLDALHALVKDLNRSTRAICRSLGSSGNLAGAEQVLTWTTGYPAAIDFSRGYPRYSPGEFSAREILKRGEADVLLLLGSSPSLLSQCTAAELNKLSVISCASSAEALAAAVAFRVAKTGVQSGGTTYRVDGVPLPLRPPLTSQLPSDAEVLTLLRAALN